MAGGSGKLSNLTEVCFFCCFSWSSDFYHCTNEEGSIPHWLDLMEGRERERESIGRMFLRLHFADSSHPSHFYDTTFIRFLSTGRA